MPSAVHAQVPNMANLLTGDQYLHKPASLKQISTCLFMSGYACQCVAQAVNSMYPRQALCCMYLQRKSSRATWFGGPCRTCQKAKQTLPLFSSGLLAASSCVSGAWHSAPWTPSSSHHVHLQSHLTCFAHPAHDSFTAKTLQCLHNTGCFTCQVQGIEPGLSEQLWEPALAKSQTNQESGRKRNTSNLWQPLKP